MDLKNGYGFGIRSMPIILIAQLFGVTSCILVLYLVLHYDGGLAFHGKNKFKIYNVHPVCMFLGFIFLSSQAILSYKMVPAKKEVQKAVHLLLLGSGIILGGIGIYAVFKFHKETGIPNMYSLHSWFGMIAFVLFGVQVSFLLITLHFFGNFWALGTA